jgi:hypothetical protein
MSDTRYVEYVFYVWSLRKVDEKTIFLVVVKQSEEFISELKRPKQIATDVRILGHTIVRIEGYGFCKCKRLVLGFC